jgi:N-methylhydantoinase A/oxoprolinase/acetone carboxylase beta subunit
MKGVKRNSGAPIVETRGAIFGGRSFQAPVHERAEMQRGHQVVGPAIVSEYSATTVVPPGWRGVVDAWGNLILNQPKGTGR